MAGSKPGRSGKRGSQLRWEYFVEERLGGAAGAPAGFAASDDLAQPGAGIEGRLEQLRAYRDLKREARTASPDGPVEGLVAVAGGPNWVPIGPLGAVLGQAAPKPVVSGRVQDLAVSKDGQRVYLATANGGVWRTGDSGRSWEPMSDELDALEVVIPGGPGGVVPAPSAGRHTRHRRDRHGRRRRRGPRPAVRRNRRGSRVLRDRHLPRLLRRRHAAIRRRRTDLVPGACGPATPRPDGLRPRRGSHRPRACRGRDQRRRVPPYSRELDHAGAVGRGGVAGDRCRQPDHQRDRRPGGRTGPLLHRGPERRHLRMAAGRRLGRAPSTAGRVEPQLACGFGQRPGRGLRVVRDPGDLCQSEEPERRRTARRAQDRPVGRGAGVVHDLGCTQRCVRRF